MRKQKPKQEPEISKEEDHLEVYPEKKQVSAFPERRFIKMNRVLTIIALINLACILAGAGIFIYTAQRVGVRVQNKRGILLYQLDREEKVLKQAEYLKRKFPAKRFVMESFLRQYITERNSYNVTLDEFNARQGEKGLVARASLKGLKNGLEKDFSILRQQVIAQNKIRDVHIYNLHPYQDNLWTAVIETFDFPKPTDFPFCNCYDNSEECLKCKIKNTLFRQRRRIWIRASFTNPQKNSKYRWVRKKPEELKETSIDNPFGIYIEGYHVGYMPKDAVNQNWDLPPEIRLD